MHTRYWQSTEPGKIFTTKTALKQKAKKYNHNKNMKSQNNYCIKTIKCW